MKHIVSQMSSYFPNRWPLSYLNLIENIHKAPTAQKNFKHQDIKQKEPPHKYRLGTISNTKLLAGLNRFYRILTSPSASAVVHCDHPWEIAYIVDQDQNVGLNRTPTSDFRRT